MATARNCKKHAVVRKSGKVDRTATALAFLAAFGPQDDRTLTENIGRVDDTANVTNVQWSLYQLRNKKLAVKSDETWASV